MKATLVLVASILMSGTGLSQQHEQAQGHVKIPGGTPISVRLTTAISSRTAHPGDTVACEVADDVIIDKFLVVKKGAPVQGNVIEAKRAGHLAKGARLMVDLRVAQAVDGQGLAIHATQASNGKNANKNMVAGTAVLTFFGGPAGLFYLLKHGHETEIPAGTLATVNTVVDQYVSGTPITIAHTPPAP